MRPYDWCDPRCPNPCTCQETIEENLEIERAARGVKPMYLVTQPEAVMIRMLMRQHDRVFLISDEMLPRVFAPPGKTAIVYDVATGKARCRECGERIPKGARVIAFGFEPVRMERLQRPQRAYIHAGDCPPTEGEKS